MVNRHKFLFLLLHLFWSEPQKNVSLQQKLCIDVSQNGCILEMVNMAPILITLCVSQVL